MMDIKIKENCVFTFNREENKIHVWLYSEPGSGLPENIGSIRFFDKKQARSFGEMIEIMTTGGDMKVWKCNNCGHEWECCEEKGLDIFCSCCGYYATVIEKGAEKMPVVPNIHGTTFCFKCKKESAIEKWMGRLADDCCYYTCPECGHEVEG